MRILSVFGTRPEALKMASIIKGLSLERGVESLVCVSAQHRYMLDQVIHLFGIRVDYDLNIMKPGQSLTEVTTSILENLKGVLQEVQPDLLLVQGDTTTAFAAALAAFYEKIPVGHVEAGLRTQDRMTPYPEEMNRRLISSLAKYHFAPTPRSKNNLLQEGVCQERIFVTGNTGIDALLFTMEQLKKKPELAPKPFPFLDPGKKLILVTVHRRESFGKGFFSICKALQRLAQRKDVHILFPVHLNPNVRKPVYELLGEEKNIHLIEPLDYFSFVHLMSQSTIVLTDSGGIQEEAPSLGKPVLVLRELTERPEALEAGTAILVGTNETKILSETEKLLEDPLHYQTMAQTHNPYGDGRAAERILEQLLRSCKDA